MADKPSPSPAEAPEIKSIKELQDRKADILKYLQDIPNLNTEEKAGFASEYETALKALESKTDTEKLKDIGSIKAELEKLRSGLKNEKEDENDEVDEKEDDEAGVQKLNVEKEIRGRIDEFKKNIEAKLNAPATPEKTEEVPPETQDDIQTAKKFFENKGVKLDTAPIQEGNWLRDFFKKLLLGWYGILEGFGVNVSNAKAKLEGYKDYISKQKVEETFKVLSGYMGDSVKGITEIKDKEALIDKMEGLGLPLLYGTDNLLAGPIMKLIFTGEKSAWDDLPEDFDHDIIKTIRGKYLTLQKNPKSLGGKTTLQRLNEIFTIDEDKKGEYITRYEDDQEERETKEKPETGPILGPVEAPILTEAEKRAEEVQKIKDAKEADTNLEKAKAELDEQTEENETKQKVQKKVDEATLKVKELVNISKEKVEALKKETESAIKDLESKIKIAQGDVDQAMKVNSKSPTPTNKANLDVVTKTRDDLQKKLTSKQDVLNDTDPSHIIKTDLTKELMKFKNTEITAEDAVSSAQKAKRIVETKNDILKSQEQQEQKKDEQELPPLSPSNENNLVYFEGKLYQSVGNEWNPEYREMYYESGELKRSGKFSDGKILRHEKGNLLSLVTKGCKVIPYGEANDIVRGLDDAKKNLNNIWIEIKSEHFAGKLRNIKV